MSKLVIEGEYNVLEAIHDVIDEFMRDTRLADDLGLDFEDLENVYVSLDWMVDVKNSDKHKVALLTTKMRRIENERARIRKTVKDKKKANRQIDAMAGKYDSYNRQIKEILERDPAYRKKAKLEQAVLKYDPRSFEGWLSW